MQKTITYFLVVAIIVLGALLLILNNNSEPQNDSATPEISYKDIEYIIDGQPVILANGVSEVEAAPGSASKIVTRYFGNNANGDLNGDNIPDIGFILTQETGGSGTFYYVAVALKTETGYRGTNAILLGDRIAPQTTKIKNGGIIVNYADRKEDEPMTAQPSVGVSRYFQINGDELIEINI